MSWKLRTTTASSHRVWTTELAVRTIDGFDYETLVLAAGGEIIEWGRYATAADASEGHLRAVGAFS